MNQDLIQKYLKGETTTHENQEILQWIESNVENRKQFMQFRRLYDATIWHDTDTSISKADNITTKTTRFTPLVKRWMQVAAIITVAVIGTIFIQQNLFRSSEKIYTQIIEVPLGQRVNLTLSDGTKVSLNSNSKLHFPTSFKGNKRMVVLDGEGFFEVTHNADKPFHVLTNQCDIEVLGTTFNVLAYNNSDIFETSLLEGSVNIKNLRTSQSTLLKPNERASLETGRFVTTIFDTEDDFLWRNGIYVFKNELLTDVFKKLEQYYQINIIVKNRTISSSKCTGKFRQKEGIEHIIKVLQSANDFKYKRNEDKNTIVIY